MNGAPNRNRTYDLQLRNGLSGNYIDLKELSSFLLCRVLTQCKYFSTKFSAPTSHPLRHLSPPVSVQFLLLTLIAAANGFSNQHGFDMTLVNAIFL